MYQKFFKSTVDDLNKFRKLYLLFWCVFRDVKDRAVLKIYETEAPSVRSPSRSPKTVRSGVYYSGAAQDGSGPHSPAHHATAPPRNFDQVSPTQMSFESSYNLF